MTLCGTCRFFYTKIWTLRKKEDNAEQMNVPICTGVTALTHDPGEVGILDFGQGLWFENRMEKLLMNPNQCQKFGIQI